MRLNDIGFYTLTDERVKQVSATSPLYRCELILTTACNFHCPYCRSLRPECRGVMPLEQAQRTLGLWIDGGLKNVRFSGGEPMTYAGLPLLVAQAYRHGVEHIALSTNGSFAMRDYERLVDLGVNDFSISLDACCASDGDLMSGGVKGAWSKVVANIRELAKLTYVTVGIVLTEDNINQAPDIIRFADELGVDDIRVISAAQFNRPVEALASITDDLLNRHPILKYRVNNFRSGRSMRGLGCGDSRKCKLVLDDMAVSGKWHWPCIIYLREGGNPIGKVGSNMRQQRAAWSESHNCHEDCICSTNCLEVCADYNNRVRDLNV